MGSSRPEATVTSGAGKSRHHIIQAWERTPLMISIVSIMPPNWVEFAPLDSRVSDLALLGPMRKYMIPMGLATAGGAGRQAAAGRRQQ